MTLRRITPAVAFLAVCVSLSEHVAGPRLHAAEPEGLSLVQLIARPLDYQGKIVKVVGFCWFEHEGNGLYLHEEDFRHGLTRNALWIDLGWPEPDEYRKLRGRYVLVEGVFDAERKGHGNLFSGTLGDIRRLVPWPSRKELEAAERRSSGPE